MDAGAATEQKAINSQPLFKKRGAKANNIRKRPATPPPDNGDSSSGYTSTEDEGGRSIKRRRKTAVVTASSTNNPSSYPSSKDLSTTKYTGDRSAQITDTNDATKQSNWYDEADAKQLLGSTRSQPARTGDPSNDGTTYKGQAAYKSFVTRNPNAPSSKTVGPVKAPTNVRTITITDFAPDVCKDYKQVGFCGFGDSCKYLHAREDYKQGWQLDKDWEKAGNNSAGGGGGGGGHRRKKPVGDNTAGAEDDDDDAAAAALLEKIPFACIICKSDYKNPIVTKCEHYFCEACALQRYRKTPSCAACGAGTNGVFNGAKNLKKLLERKTERERQKREKAEAEGAEEGAAAAAVGAGGGGGGGGGGSGHGDGSGSGSGKS